MELRDSFDLASGLYDEMRPSYPDEVIDWIVGKTGMTPGDRLLEIGPGTGQATVKFIQRGYRVHCVEKGQSLAGLLLQKLGDRGVTADVSAFEAWRPREPFRTKLIYSATAFHWIDKAVKYEKCAGLLEDGGYLVLLWNVRPDEPPLPVERAYALLRECCPAKENRKKDEVVAERKREIADCGYFTLEDYLDFPWTLRWTRASLAGDIFSQSAFLSLPADVQRKLAAQVNRLYEELEETTDTEYHTTVYLGRKK